VDHESPATDTSAPLERLLAGPVAWITTAQVVGVGAALAAFIDGIVLMAKRTVKDCPNGTFFPAGTKDFTCHAHPRLGEGLAISGISLSVGVLVLLLGYVAVATLNDSRETR
jgi:hypothetical protein